ncbi:MAG: hypothetical protein R3244_00145 [Thermoanaerobaculia bacterium]|nr:hypothetical protein [Thermoanaerobaculia bacterium]
MFSLTPELRELRRAVSTETSAGESSWERLVDLDFAMEAMGGRGFDEEYGVVQLWETARLLKLSPLSNALILSDVAERELDLPRSY